MNDKIKEQLDMLKTIKTKLKLSIEGKKQEVSNDKFSSLVESCNSIDHDDFKQYSTNKEMNIANAKQGDFALVYNRSNNALGGLYKYDGIKYNPVETSFSVNRNFAYNGTYLGNNGIETGTMENFTPNSQAELIKFLDLYNNINENGIIMSNKLGVGTGGFAPNLTAYPSRILIDSTVERAKGIDNTNTKEIIVTSLGESNLTSLFNFCDGLETLEKADLSGVRTPKLTAMGQMFARCANLKEIDISNFDTSNVTSMSSLFRDCKKLEILKVPNWSTSNVKEMGYMFANCNMLTNLDVSGFDTSKVTSLRGMFQGCRSLEVIDVSNWNTSKATRMDDMFSSCVSVTELNVSNWNTGNVENMEGMFSGCRNLKELDVSGWNVDKVTITRSMFSGCANLSTLDISNWNLSNVTSLGSMFANCSSLSEQSVIGIVKALQTATKITAGRYKTLEYIGLYDYAEFIQTLPEWEACVAAGWRVS